MSTKRYDASKIKLMGFDIDGVMTDGRLFFAADGSELKAFNTLDGLGLKMLMDTGIELAIITGRQSEAVTARAKNLSVRHVFQGVQDKNQVLKKLLEKLKLDWTEAGFMGDDLIDLPAMLPCGFAAAPANSHAQVQREVLDRGGLLCQNKGGEGAVREACEYILETQNKLDPIIKRYLTMQQEVS